jgi:CBS domain-containing protein
MPLNLSIIESFLNDNGEALKNRALLRHERARILAGLYNELQESLKDYETFESEFRSLVVHKIEIASTYGELYGFHRRAVGGVETYFLEEDNVVDVHDLFRIVRDGITVRVLQLVEQEMRDEGRGDPPCEYAWMGLGSEGRDEQTMMTDQDNMVIYGEDADGKGADYFSVFAEKAVEGLHEAGFEKCKGGVMPTNDKWRGSLRDWKERLDERLTFDRGILEALDIIIFTDARCIAGKKALLDDLLKYFFARLTDNKRVMKDFIESAVLMPTALSFFGGFKMEKGNEHKDKLNIKLLGWAPLILAVRMLALANGIFVPNTLKRIQLLRERGVIKKDMENELIEGYLIFVKFRIMNQIRNKDTDNPGGLSYVKPDMLGPEGQEGLRKAMKTVEALQKYVQEVLLFGQPI